MSQRQKKTPHAPKEPNRKSPGSDELRIAMAYAQALRHVFGVVASCMGPSALAVLANDWMEEFYVAAITPAAGGKSQLGIPRDTADALLDEFRRHRKTVMEIYNK